MKNIKFFAAILFCWSFLACDQSSQTSSIMTETTAKSLLAASDCYYKFDDNSPSPYLVYESPNWVLKAEGCGGTCKVNETTQAITMDDNPMCTGAIP